MEPLRAHLLDAASRAPSAHNTQPWAVAWDGEAMSVFIRRDRMLPAVDGSGADLLHAIGALLENVILTLYQLDRDPSYTVADRVEPETPIVTVHWRPASGPRPDPTLYRMIPVRQTSRLPYDARPIAAEDLDALRSVVGVPCALTVLTGADEIAEIRRLVAEATAAQFRDPAVTEELYGWMRFTRRDQRWFRDGLNADCLGLRRWEAEVLRFLLAPRVLRLFGRWGLIRLLTAPIDQHAPPAPAIALLTVEGDAVARRIEAGRCLQRIWLTAAARGLSAHPISAAVDRDETRPRVLERFQVAPGSHHVNLFRLGVSRTAGRSPRLPVDELIRGSSSV
jgi:hypothetical protein